MLNALKKLTVISRPVSWPNTAYPFAAAYLVTGGDMDIVFWIATFYFLIPYNLLMYGINDVFDYESDIRNPRKGGIEGAKVRKDFHPIILWAAAASNIPFLAVMAAAGTPLANIVLACLVFFVVAYSIAGLRFKEIPGLDSVTSSIHFVGPMVYALVLTGLEPTYAPYVTAFFLWGIASHAFGAVQDIIPDREGGLRSIATALGARITMWGVFLLYVTASILIACQGWPAIAIGTAGFLYAANTAPFLGVNDATSAKTNQGWRRFIWLNLFTGFLMTIVLLSSYLLT